MGAGWIHRPLTGATLFTGFVAALSSSDGCFTPDFAFGKIIFNGLVEPSHVLMTKYGKPEKTGYSSFDSFRR
jgi:hypothetical protein